MRTLLLLIAVLGGMAAPGLARESDEITVGTRVRVARRGALDRYVEGKVLHIGNDMLTLGTAGDVDSLQPHVARIRFDDLGRLEAWSGRRRSGHFGRSFRNGTVAGIFLGAAIFKYVLGLGLDDPPIWKGVVYGGAAGGALGLAAAAVSVEDTWQPASLPSSGLRLSLGPAPGRGWQAGVSVRF
jgi:hypothetical protein